MKNLGLVPLMNFAQVDEYVFRSAQPHYAFQYDWLRNKLGIEILVDLRKESDLDERVGIEHGFDVFELRIPDHHAPTLEQTQQFREFYEAHKDKKILIHCAHGQGRTTTFCVIVRLIQGWSLEDALREQSEVYGYHFKHKEQLEFLKSL